MTNAVLGVSSNGIPSLEKSVRMFKSWYGRDVTLIESPPPRPGGRQIYYTQTRHQYVVSTSNSNMLSIWHLTLFKFTLVLDWGHDLNRNFLVPLSWQTGNIGSRSRVDENGCRLQFTAKPGEAPIRRLLSGWACQVNGQNGGRGSLSEP